MQVLVTYLVDSVTFDAYMACSSSLFIPSDDIVFMCNLEKVKLWVNIFAFSYVFSVIFTQLTTGGKFDIKEGLSFSSLLLNFGTFICFITFRLTTDNIETPTQYASNHTCLNGEMQRLNTDN